MSQSRSPNRHSADEGSVDMDSFGDSRVKSHQKSGEDLSIPEIRIERIGSSVKKIGEENKEDQYSPRKRLSENSEENGESEKEQSERDFNVEYQIDDKDNKNKYADKDRLEGFREIFEAYDDKDTVNEDEPSMFNNSNASFKKYKSKDHDRMKKANRTKADGKFQVTCKLILYLIFVALILTIILEIGVLIMMNLTYSIERSSSMVESLSKEAMAVMDVYKNMSQRFIQKDEWLLKGVLEANSVDDYPLDWTKLAAGIPQYTSTLSGLEENTNFGTKKIAPNQMTYVPVNGNTANALTDDKLKRLNMLNEVWKKVNLVKLGYEFNVDITSTFFMIKDLVDNKSILATFPGQDATVTDFTTYDFYNQARASTSDYITITLRDDPFNSGMGQVVGYCKGFDITGKYEGVVGIFYSQNADTFTKLISPVALKADNNEANCSSSNSCSTSITYSLYQVTPSGDVLLANTDTKSVISGHGNVYSILYLQTENITLVLRDIHHSNENGYLLEPFSQKRDSGALYKASGIYGPYYFHDTDRTKYDFRAIFIQENDAAFGKLFQNKSIHLIHIAYLGLMYFLVLIPIRNLTKVPKKYSQEENVKDEIVAFKKYENEGQYNVITNYEYPVNVYFNKDLKDELNEIVGTVEVKKGSVSDQISISDRNLSEVGSKSVLSDPDDVQISKRPTDCLLEKAYRRINYAPPIQIPFEQLKEEMRKIIRERKS